MLKKNLFVFWSSYIIFTEMSFLELYHFIVMWLVRPALKPQSPGFESHLPESFFSSKNDSAFYPYEVGKVESSICLVLNSEILIVLQDVNSKFVPSPLVINSTKFQFPRPKKQTLIFNL